MSQYTSPLVRVIKFEGSLAVSQPRLARFGESLRSTPRDPSVVRVELLPESMRAARKARKASIAVAFLTLLTILDAAAYDVATRGGAAHDQAAVAAAQVNRSALQQRADKLAPLDPFLAQVGQAQAMVSAASSGKIIWSSVLAQLLTVLPAGSSITSVTLTSSEGGQAGSSTTVYGTVALTGTTGTVREVAGILRALAGAPTLTDVYLTSTAAQNATSTAGITWTVSADITSKALATTIAAATP